MASEVSPPLVDGSGPLPPGHPYRGVPAGVATRHAKTPILRTALGGQGGLRLRTVSVDTDAFGTFTGDRPRPGPAEQVVVAKADAGAQAGGLRLGLASEGSFGPDPASALLVLQRELVALVDRDTGLTVLGGATALAPWVVRLEVAEDEPLRTVATRLRATVGRDHPVVVRPAAMGHPGGGDGTGAGISKGVVGRRGLSEALARARAASPGAVVVVETDLRAHVCGPRRPLIARAARDLARRLGRRCRGCASPGTGPARVQRGRPCRACGSPTDDVLAVVDACPACGLETTRPTPAAGPEDGADPARCPACNP